MVSDEPRGEDAGDGTFSAGDTASFEGFGEPTVRRSTYTPPPIVPPTDDAASRSDEPPAEESVAAEEPGPAVEPDLAVEPGSLVDADRVAEPVSDPAPPGVWGPPRRDADERGLDPDALYSDGYRAPQPPAAPEPAFPSAEEQAALLAQQAGPAGRPWVPQRTSKDDAELVSELSEVAAVSPLEAIEALEEQLKLREVEAHEYQDWEQSMLAVGTPEAIAAVEQVRPAFDDIVPPTSSITIIPPTPPAPGAVPPPPGPVVPPAAAWAEPGTPVVDAPLLDAAVESAPVADAPVLDAPAYDTRVFEAPVFDAPALVVPPFDDPVDAPSDEPHDPPTDELIAEPDEAPLPWAPPPLVEPPAPPSAFEPSATPPWAAPWEGASLASAGDPVPEDTIDPFADLPTPVDAEDARPDVAPIAFVEPPDTERAVPAASYEALFGAPSAPPVPPTEDTAPPAPAAEESPAWVSAPPPAGATAVGADEVMSPRDYFAALAGETVASPSGSAPVEPLAGAASVVAASPAAPAAPIVSPPSEAPTWDPVGDGIVPDRAPLEVEDVGAAPTPLEQRVGRAVRLFWLWFATNASVVSVALGAVVFGLGLSLRQAVIAALAGVVLSFLPLGLGTLAGRRSGQPTMIVSRATFGVHGNILPALVALVSRVFWGGVLLWLLGTAVADVLVGAGLNGGLAHSQLVTIGMGVGFVVALVIAFVGFRLIRIVQLVVTIASAVLIAGLIAFTWNKVDLVAALRAPDGPLLTAVAGGVLVFSVVGLVWANSAADLARYQARSTGGGSSMLFAAFGAGLPAFVLIGYGSLLAASDPAIATGLTTDPLDTLGRMMPLWYPVPLIAAAVLSLLSGVVVTVYSGSFALVAAGVRAKQTVGALVIAVLVFVVGWGVSTLAGDLTLLLRDFATTLAVPVAAWAGMFAAEVMIRNRRYHAPSLLATGGVYPAVRWGMVSAYVVVVAIGFGLTTATSAGLAWQGYLFRLAGLSTDSTIAMTDGGVIVALVLGLLTPLAIGLPSIRRQEAADPGQ